MAFRSYDAAGAVAAKQEKGIEVLIEMMQKPFLNAPEASKRKLHLKALAAILYWIWNCEENDDDDGVFFFIQQVVQCGGIPTILLSMGQFMDDVDIQKFGCYLLFFLSQNGHETAVVVDGGRRALERAQSRHTSHEDIQTCSKAALELLSGVDDADRCHKCYTTGTGLMQCGRCQKVLYCSRDCQRKDYNVHKKLCKLTAYQNKGNEVDCIECQERRWLWFVTGG